MKTRQTSTSGSLHPSCSSCAFWRAASKTSGQCRRCPPQVVAYVETNRDAYSQVHVETCTRSEFPETLAKEWCGEHQTNDLRQARAAQGVDDTTG